MATSSAHSYWVRQFSVAAPTVWKAVQNKLRQSSSLPIFKKDLKSLSFSTAFTWHYHPSASVSSRHHGAIQILLLLLFIIIIALLLFDYSGPCCQRIGPDLRPQRQTASQLSAPKRRGPCCLVLLSLYCIVIVSLNEINGDGDWRWRYSDRQSDYNVGWEPTKTAKQRDSQHREHRLSLSSVAATVPLLVSQVLSPPSKTPSENFKFTVVILCSLFFYRH